MIQVNEFYITGIGGGSGFNYEFKVSGPFYFETPEKCEVFRSNIRVIFETYVMGNFDIETDAERFYRIGKLD